MISIDGAAGVFHRHARDILKAVRSAPRGWRVMAEVDGDGRWRGAGRVTPGTTSLLAHEGRGYAIYFDADRFCSLQDVADGIEEWRASMWEMQQAGEEEPEDPAAHGFLRPGEEDPALYDPAAWGLKRAR